MLIYQLPTPAEMQKASRDGRMNIFRRYFASSRYNRLLMQQALVQSARDGIAPDIADMERSHNFDFSETIERVKMYGYYDEFLDAVKEENDALQKIIEAYDRRMNSS